MRPFALVVGESLVDVVVPPAGAAIERPGGSAANVAVALARLERDVRLLTAVGDDARGRLVERRLADARVGLAAPPRVLARTATAVAHIGTDGAAGYAFDVTWRPPVVAERLLDRPPLWLHVCSIGAVLPPGADDVAALVRRLTGRCRISYDVNARPALTGTGPQVLASVERLAAAADLVKASDEDLAVLYPDAGPDEAVGHLLGLGARVVVLTRGPDGATWYGAGAEQPVSVPAPTVRVVDTIGAGDTFVAALLDAWAGDDLPDPPAALRHAALASAVTVSRAGADPPTRAELAGS